MFLSHPPSLKAMKKWPQVRTILIIHLFLAHGIIYFGLVVVACVEQDPGLVVLPLSRALSSAIISWK